MILSDGSEIEGMVYIMLLIRLHPPTAGYYQGIRDAYKRLGFRDESRGCWSPPFSAAGRATAFKSAEPIHATCPPSLRGAGLFGFRRALGTGWGACPGRRLWAARALTWAAWQSKKRRAVA